MTKASLPGNTVYKNDSYGNTIKETYFNKHGSENQGDTYTYEYDESGSTACLS